jgi:hypothetical protein
VLQDLLDTRDLYLFVWDISYVFLPFLQNAFPHARVDACVFAIAFALNFLLDLLVQRPYPVCIVTRSLSTAKRTRTRSLSCAREPAQGTVHLGEYEEVTCAGKTFTGQDDNQLLEDVLNEAAFFLRLDHPYCHYLIGAKTTLENGGLMFLTEVCDVGSVFDV